MPKAIRQNTLNHWTKDERNVEKGHLGSYTHSALIFKIHLISLLLHLSKLQ